MTKIDTLLHNYLNHVRIPWKVDAAPMQRVWFCVYEPKDEKSLRAKLGEFELATIQSSKKWLQYDLNDSFAEWLSSHPYAEQYYKNPKLLKTVLPNYKEYLINQIKAYINNTEADEDTAFVLFGVASLFGFLKVKELIEKIAPMVKGRLVVFFPGTYENNNYRLLDGYDGWSYLAIPITSDNKL